MATRDARATAGLVAFASVWGTLTRRGLEALTTYDGQSIAPLVWAQGVGCVVMGWATYPRNRAVLERWYPPAFTMLTTGYCGSVTSYSQWIAAVFEAFANYHHYHRHGLHNVVDALTQTAATLGIAYAAFCAGRCVGGLACLEHVEAVRRARTHGAPPADADADAAPPADARSAPAARRARPWVDAACVALGVAFWVGAALLCALYARFRHVTYALVLSPPGALLRWQLAKLNAPRVPDGPGVLRHLQRWPWGTVLANVLSIVVYCAAETAQFAGYAVGPTSRGAHSIDACNALRGLQDGFCGTLSTISTLIAELVALRPPRNAFALALFSWAAGLVVSILLLGAPWWAVGMQGGCRATPLS
ncbi:hypothetical protein MBRA1_003699 [Malassezia brasiliensis]|uniref:Fluoride ion transporter CrcB n=1 Tax=Malassezia brasiliensis TaxID=1821822 RepID=A0AAF0DWY7_9BASI|nr:hypothetical protein MBRA1_003699 [Malassezia brasiliensis]